VAAIALLLALSCPCAAAPPPQRMELVPYAIVGDSIPASLTGGNGKPASGRAIVVDPQRGMCLLCHSGPFPEDKFQGNIGPNLAGVGRRLTEGQLRLRVVDSSKINPDTIMPPFYRVDALHRVAPPWRGKPVLTAAEIEDVVAFLMTMK
jgi:sulfur-oxidizing protein SoxX